MSVITLLINLIVLTTNMQGKEAPDYKSELIEKHLDDKAPSGIRKIRENSSSFRIEEYDESVLVSVYFSLCLISFLFFF